LGGTIRPWTLPEKKGPTCRREQFWGFLARTNLKGSGKGGGLQGLTLDNKGMRNGGVFRYTTSGEKEELKKTRKVLPQADGGCGLVQNTPSPDPLNLEFCPGDLWRLLFLVSLSIRFIPPTPNKSPGGVELSSAILKQSPTRALETPAEN